MNFYTYELQLNTECSAAADFEGKLQRYSTNYRAFLKTYWGRWVSLGSMYARGWISQRCTMAVQGGWVGQKRSEKHIRNMWTAPYVLNFPPRQKVWGNCHMKSEQYIFSSFFLVGLWMWTVNTLKRRTWQLSLSHGAVNLFSFHLTYLVWTFPLKVIMVLALRNICLSAF